MSTPVRFPGGVNNAPSESVFWNFGALDPSKFHQFFEDFDFYNAANWVVTETQAGATQALTDADGGVLLLTNSAADNDVNALQKVGESFLMASGKKAFFKARFKVSDATESDFVVGLQITDTTPIDVTDGIYFRKDDGDAALDIVCRKDATTGSNSATNIATVVSDTYLTVGWFYDGVSSLFYFVNDVMLGRLDASATYLPDTELTVSFGIVNGEAVAKTMSIDYVFAAKER